MSLEERVEKLEKAVRELRRLISAAYKTGEVLAEENGVQLIEVGDLYGTYAVVDRNGTVHMYKDRKHAEKVFKTLAERAG